jgi:hypothetical protein
LAHIRFAGNAKSGGSRGVVLHSPRTRQNRARRGENQAWEIMTHTWLRRSPLGSAVARPRRCFGSWPNGWASRERQRGHAAASARTARTVPRGAAAPVRRSRGRGNPQARERTSPRHPTDRRQSRLAGPREHVERKPQTRLDTAIPPVEYLAHAQFMNCLPQGFRQLS